MYETAGRITKGYRVYVPGTRKIISSYDVIFHESFSSTFAYTSQPYEEAMAMLPVVTYTTHAVSSRKKTGDIIKSTQFEEGDLLSETLDDAERGEEYDDDLIMPPLIRKEEMNNMDSGNDY